MNAPHPGIEVAGYRVAAVTDGRFKLDGGAMFGVVPKALWSREAPADAENRVDLALRCLLLRGRGRVVVVDTGMGDKWSPKLADRFGLDHREDDLDRALARHGVARADVTDCILTHLHFDHAGGATVRDGDAVRPRFPNATYHTGRAHWHWAHDPTEKDRASFRREDFEPLADQLRLVDTTEDEILPGIRPWFSDGHTVGLMHPLIEDAEGGVFYCADLVPTAAHLRLPFVMGYDLHPLTTIEEKRRLFRRAAEQSWVLVFEHDPRIAAARVSLDSRGDAIIAAPISL